MSAGWTRSATLAALAAAAAGCSWRWGELEGRFDGGGGVDSPVVPESGPDVADERVPPDAEPFDVTTDVVMPDAPADELTPDVTMVDGSDVLDVPDMRDVSDVPDVTELPCAAGTERTGPGQPCLPAVLPRLLAPLSNAVVTQRAPTLRVWMRDAAAGEIRPTQLRVEICSDAICTTPLALTVSVPATGNVVAIALPSDLAPGWHAWRASALTSGGSSAATARWTFWVPGGPSPSVDSFTGFSPHDVTPSALGDGFADPMVSATPSGGSMALLFAGTASGLGSTAYLLARPAQATSGFGSAMAVVGPVLSAGAPASAVVVGDPGVAGFFLYDVTNPTFGQPVTSGVSSTQGAASEAGASLVALGDADGGGYADFAVGIPGSDTVQVYAGETFVDTLRALATLHCPSGCTGLGVGATIANAGDVNGDGHPEILVGRRVNDAIDVWTFDPASSTYTPAAMIDPPGATLAAMAGVGDLNTDGYADVAVGTDTVLALYLGGPSGLATVPDRTMAVPGITAIAALGDTESDGTADFVVSNQAGGFQGLSWYYSVSGPYQNPGNPTWPTFQVVEMSMMSSLGVHLAGVGDVNGDGRGDLLAADPMNNKVVLFEGLQGGPPMRIDFPSPSPSVITNFGQQVAARAIHRARRRWVL